jgi:hypothetical protein
VQSIEHTVKQARSICSHNLLVLNPCSMLRSNKGRKNSIPKQLLTNTTNDVGISLLKCFASAIDKLIDKAARIANIAPLILGFVNIFFIFLFRE